METLNMQSNLRKGTPFTEDNGSKLELIGIYARTPPPPRPNRQNTTYNDLFGPFLVSLFATNNNKPGFKVWVWGCGVYFTPINAFCSTYVGGPGRIYSSPTLNPQTANPKAKEPDPGILPVQHCAMLCRTCAAWLCSGTKSTHT